MWLQRRKESGHEEMFGSWGSKGFVNGKIERKRFIKW